MVTLTPSTRPLSDTLTAASVAPIATTEPATVCIEALTKLIAEGSTETDALTAATAATNEPSRMDKGNVLNATATG
jgi:hypothetical protein